MSKLGKTIKFSKGTFNVGVKSIKGFYHLILGQLKAIKRGVRDTKTGFKMIKEIRAAKAEAADKQAEDKSSQDDV